MKKHLEEKENVNKVAIEKTISVTEGKQSRRNHFK